MFRNGWRGDGLCCLVSVRGVEVLGVDAGLLVLEGAAGWGRFENGNDGAAGIACSVLPQTVDYLVHITVEVYLELQLANATSISLKAGFHQTPPRYFQLC